MAEITAANIEAALKKQLDSLNTTVDTREVGTVIQVGDGIARIEGLRDAMAGELLELVSSSTGKKVYGLAQNLEGRRKSVPFCLVTLTSSRKVTRFTPPAVFSRFPCPAGCSVA